MKNLLVLLSVCLISLSVSAREQVKIVGSSTVYPFSSYVAEEFGSLSRYPTPVVESTGTGGGVKLFCSDNSMDSPDIVNASRRIKIKEYQLCRRNGVSNITEVMFGYDGIVIGQSSENDTIKLSMEELLLAVAKQVPNPNGSGLIENPYQYWSDINPELPKRKITIYGPPLSSGTRDAFEEIVMQYQTEEMKVYRDAGLKGYRIIRSDGVYIPSGENDNLIVQKLTKDKDALGIFGYSFLSENSDLIAGIAVDDVEPSSDNIADKSYPISRSLYFYIKNRGNAEVPAIDEFVEMFLNTDLIGEEGLLTEIGLIPLSEDIIAENYDRFINQEKLELSTLEKNS